MASDQAVTAAAPDAAPEEPQGGVLTNRDFRKLFVGESVSLMGTFITGVAMPLTAVLTLHATVFEVGLLNVFRLSPVIVVALFAGVWLDRVKRRPVLICCSLGCAASIGLVPIAHTFGFLSLGVLYVAVAVAGALNVIFDVGALSYVPSLVEKRHLLEANGKMQATRATGAIAGPAIAGLLIGLITAPVTLSADAISYLCSAAGLSLIRKPEPAPEVPEHRQPLRQQLAEGFRAVYSGPTAALAADHLRGAEPGLRRVLDHLPGVRGRGAQAQPVQAGHRDLGRGGRRAARRAELAPAAGRVRTTGRSWSTAPSACPPCCCCCSSRATLA